MPLGGGQGQLRADGLPGAGHRVLVALSIGSGVASSGGGGLMRLGLELHPLFRSPPSLGELLLKDDTEATTDCPSLNLLSETVNEGGGLAANGNVRWCACIRLPKANTYNERTAI